MQPTDKRIEWLRENVPHFKDANDKADAARQDTEAYRRKFAAYLSQKVPMEKAS